MPQLWTHAPDVIYKLRGLRRFKRDVDCLLRDRQLYLASPKDLNDPFDLYPRLRVPPPSRREATIRGILREGERYGEGARAAEIRRRCELLCSSPAHRGRYLDEFYREDLATVAVCSFSRPVDNPVLWSHYASEHRGFAVGYRARTDGELEAVPAFPVIYRTRRAPIDPLRFGQSDMFRVVRTKAREWAYEGEWRYVEPAGGPRCWDVPAGAIVEVCLGTRMPRWHKLRVIAAARALPDKPRILQAFFDEERFALRFRRVD